MPNPFTNETEITYYLPVDCNVDFEIFNLIGERIRRDVAGRDVACNVSTAGKMPKGKHSITFNSNDLPAGTYYYRLRTPGFEETKKMTVIK